MPENATHRVCDANLLACLLLNEYFGETVKEVAKCLMTHGAQTMGMVSKHTSIQMPQIREAMRVLIQHHVVTFQQHRSGLIEYLLHINNVLQFMRYPKYIECTNNLQIEGANFLFETILLNGQITMSDVVQKVTKKVNAALNDTSTIPCQLILDKFEKLVNMNFFIRCPVVVRPTKNEGTASAVPTMAHPSSSLFQVPKINQQLLAMQCTREKPKDDDCGEPAEKKPRLQESDVKPQLDTDIYWMINFDRMHEYLRDQLLISAIENRIDKRAAAVVKFICHAVETRSDAWTIKSNAVSRHAIEQEMKNSNYQEPDFDKYLAFLSDDVSKFILKEGDSQGGMYSVSRKEAITELTFTTLESVILERFGSKSLRIFRLIRLRKYLEQQQIEQKAMIPPKDAKELTYKMLSENFLQVKEISRTPDHSPSRTLYFFHIDLPRVVKKVLEWCYKMASNLIMKREQENKDNRRLLEKQDRVEAIILSLKQAGSDEADCEEVQEMITPPERAQLDKIKQHSQKLELGELQIDETIFILQLYQRYFREKD